MPNDNKDATTLNMIFGKYSDFEQYSIEQITFSVNFALSVIVMYI